MIDDTSGQHEQADDRQEVAQVLADRGLHRVPPFPARRLTTGAAAPTTVPIEPFAAHGPLRSGGLDR